MNYSTDFPSIKDQVSAEEWQTRCELAACYRLVDAYEMTDLICNHITASIPGTGHLLIRISAASRAKCSTNTARNLALAQNSRTHP